MVAIEQLQPQLGWREGLSDADGCGARAPLGAGGPPWCRAAALTAQAVARRADIGLADQVLAACQDRPAPVVPQREEATPLVRALLLAGAFERLGQQRVREHSPRAPARCRACRTSRDGVPDQRAVCDSRNNSAHVMAAADQEHRRAPAPASRALDPQRAICPNRRAHASSARCPSPETRKVLRGAHRHAHRRPSRSTSAC